MKDLSGDLSRGGRPGHDARVHRRHRQRLRELRIEDGRDLREPRDRKAPKGKLPGTREIINWRVVRSGNIVLAIEPNREYENTFTGGADPFMAALEYAAAELRREMDGVNGHTGTN